MSVRRWEPWPLTLGIAGVSTCVSFTYYAMSTTLPVAARDLGDPGAFGWAMALFMGGNVVGVCIARILMTRMRPWRAEAAGLALLIAGLLLAAFAPTASVLIVARLTQGVGAGIDVVTLYLLIGRCYPPGQRPALIALTNYCLVIPGMLGPSLAGWISHTIGWRWVFVLLAALLVPSSIMLVSGSDP